MNLVGQRIPNWYQVQHESFHGSLTCNGRSTGQRLGVEAGTIDFHRSRLSVNQPGKLGTVGQPLLHLVAQHAIPVRLGTQFNHEIGAHRPVTAKRSRIQILDSLLENSSGIRRRAGTVRQQPIAELAHDFAVPGSRPGVGQGHDDQFPVGGRFQIEVRMFGAQLREGFVGHGADGQDRWQVGLINRECHIFQFTPCSENDHITAVTAWRNSNAIYEKMISDGVVKAEKAQRERFDFDLKQVVSSKRVFSASGKQRCNANRKTGQQRGFQSVAPFQYTDAGLRPHMQLDVFVIQQPHFPTSGTEVIPNFSVHIHHVFGWGKYFHRDVRSVRKGNCFQIQLLPPLSEKDRKIGPADGIVADAAIGLANRSADWILAEIDFDEVSCLVSDNAMQRDWARQWDQFSVNQFIIFIFRRVHLRELFGGHQRFGCHAVMLLAGIYIHVIALDRNYFNEAIFLRESRLPGNWRKTDYWARRLLKLLASRIDSYSRLRIALAPGGGSDLV